MDMWFLKYLIVAYVFIATATLVSLITGRQRHLIEEYGWLPVVLGCLVVVALAPATAPLCVILWLAQFFEKAPQPKKRRKAHGESVRESMLRIELELLRKHNAKGAKIMTDLSTHIIRQQQMIVELSAEVERVKKAAPVKHKLPAGWNAPSLN